MFMGIKEQIQADMVTSMKGGDKARTDAIRLLRAAIQKFDQERVSKEYSKRKASQAAHTAEDENAEKISLPPASEEDLLGVIVKEIKQRRDSIEQFQKGGRQDLADKEESEIRIFETYLPTQLSREEIAQVIAGLIVREGKDFRKIMPLASKELKGKAEGKVINEVVKELTA